MSMIKAIILLSVALLISGCGEDKQKVSFNWEKSRLEYSYPYDGQHEVSVHAPIVLRFSQPLLAGEDLSEVVLLDAQDQPVLVAAELVDAGRSLVLKPAQKLKPTSEYHLTIGSLATELGAIVVPEDGITFRTRGLRKGPRDSLSSEPGFVITRLIPDGEERPLMDFSSLRLQFNLPLDVGSVRYGLGVDDTLSLTDSAGNLVPAIVYANGYYITVDPLEDLLADEEYRFATPGGFVSVTGEVTGAAEKVFKPLSSFPREILVQRAADSNGGSILSPLSGAAINAVPVNALLLGDKSLSQQQGDVYAELAFIPNYPKVSPLRVPRGSLLSGSSVTVNIAGEVPAGFDTGAINVAFVTDAVGFLLPNPYTSDPASPRHVQLLMDLAMTAESSQANGALSQDMLHVELYGTAIVEDGVLVINAIGMVEPEVLGLETSWGVLSFNLRALADQVGAPAPLVDSIAPSLQSWLPGTDVAMATPGEPIILNFSEPMDATSVEQAGALSLSLNGAAQDFDVYLDGASLVIKPHIPIHQPRSSQNANYQLVVDAPLRDVAGNLLDQQYILDFALPEYVDTSIRSPLALTAYPGYPCESSGRSINLDSPAQPTEHHGRCVGGKNSDDLLPLSRLPANRPIRVQFSQDMDLQSMQLGGSVVVERRVNGGWVAEAGTLRADTRVLEFWPNQSWLEGQLYRYRLRSNGSRTSSAGTNCDGTQAVCSVDGLPLQTRLLSQDHNEATAPQAGGPDLVILFRGGAETTSILQALRNLPSIDANGNMIHETSVESMPQPDGNGGYITPFNSTHIVGRNPSASGALFKQANVGCGFIDVSEWWEVADWQPVDCLENRYIYLTGALNAEVVGYEAGEDAVRVNILPTIIHTSSLAVEVEAIIIGPKAAPTGPQVMRIRHRFNPASGRRDLPVEAWIRETAEGPVLETTLDLYLDAPELHADALGITLNHNQLSLPLTMTISGPVNFLDDGRMHIVQSNADPINISVVVGGNNINLVIPAGGVNLSYISEAVKR